MYFLKRGVRSQESEVGRRTIGSNTSRSSILNSEYLILYTDYCIFCIPLEFTMIRIHYLQHVPYEDPAYILSYAVHKGFAVSQTKLYEEKRFPQLSSFDWLIIMGGPMNIYDTEHYPLLDREKRFIESAIKANKLVLGVCLGAQLIAGVLGARVVKNKYKEIGWFDVRSTIAPEGRDSAVVKAFPDIYTAFHWHGDTFEVPSGAQRFAQSDACETRLSCMMTVLLRSSSTSR